MRSWSVTCAATTVTVQVSLPTKSVTGSSEKVVDAGVATAGCGPLVEQEIVNQVPVTITGSLNVTEMFAPTATPLAPADGVVRLTAGGWSLQFPSGDAELRGVGAPAVKSAALLSMSTQPPAARSAADVFMSPGADAEPSKQFVADP